MRVQGFFSAGLEGISRHLTMFSGVLGAIKGVSEEVLEGVP